MKVLELFAGSRSFSKVAEQMGMLTFTTDLVNFENIDLVIDILDLDNHLLMEKLFEKGGKKFLDDLRKIFKARLLFHRKPPWKIKKIRGCQRVKPNNSLLLSIRRKQNETNRHLE